MIDQLRALVAESATPSKCDRATLRSGMRPIAALTETVRAQLAVNRQLLIDAELAAVDDPSADAKLEHMRQTLKAIEVRASAFETTGRDLLKAMAQWDRYMLAAQQDLEAIVATPLSAS